ncbi:MAG TPA: ATP-binding cassette domain-containing protein [Bacteroidales bacterium]|nr:ATP-binding cassette domain-containing protein [Bacteroidales bacterium]HOH22253.1 ATP-binding cassette domain-containing protein [Bacteroidales bacterium]HPB57262.1 ATP-binding cassette domain-containing protein [Bacteroidales bacterium]HPZ03700.1 ATP-binding cassette domain-containing protein [Bacteroidales bacterium]HQB75164.1 ATP-binding cassette domain-containing protein [Bacteroidales bacterium]
MITVKNIYKQFDDFEVLKNINTQFEEGKINLIIGRSGSGKTVLLKCIIGLMKPTSGQILFDNRDFSIFSEKEQKKMKMEMGVVFQGAALFDSLTIQENVMFPLNMLTDQSLEEKLERINYCLQRVGLENTNHLYPSELSGGMKKRAAIARAIAAKPRYLFCDEPNSGLDPKTSIMIDELLFGITHEFNITTIINSHDLNTVITIGENIAYLQDGCLEWQGNKENVLTSDNQKLNSFIYAQPLTQKIREFIKQ